MLASRLTSLSFLSHVWGSRVMWEYVHGPNVGCAGAMGRSSASSRESVGRCVRLCVCACKPACERTMSARVIFTAVSYAKQEVEGASAAVMQVQPPSQGDALGLGE